MKAICTIITKNYIHFAVAVHKSIQRFIEDIQMHVLIVEPFDKKDIPSNEGINFYPIESILDSKTGDEIYKKYYQKNMDHFRWSSKPVFMIELLHNDIDELFYLDSDLFFFNNPDFLFEELTNQNILLSPHFRTSDPSVDYQDFGRNNTHGLFNGGFVGANRSGIPALEWWADTCLKACVKDRKRGYYVDQSHLSLIPVLFEKTGIINNRGCNVASWNRNTCTRALKNDEVVLSEKDSLVFIHFTNDTIKGILDGTDPLLIHLLKEYVNTLKTVNSDFDLLKKYSPSFLDKLITPSRSKHIQQQIEWIQA